MVGTFMPGTMLYGCIYVKYFFAFNAGYHYCSTPFNLIGAKRTVADSHQHDKLLKMWKQTLVSRLFIQQLPFFLGKGYVYVSLRSWSDRRGGCLRECISNYLHHTYMCRASYTILDWLLEPNWNHVVFLLP